MDNNVVVGLAFANVHGRADAQAARQFIVDNASDCEAYELAPAPPGVMRAAALDWNLIIQMGGSVASIATLLWMAYDRFIAPKKKLPKDDAGIYIAIRRPDGTVKDFWIGKNYVTEEAFVQDFTQTIDDIRANDPIGFWREAVAEVRESETWVRIPRSRQQGQ